MVVVIIHSPPRIASLPDLNKSPIQVHSVSSLVLEQILTDKNLPKYLIKQKPLKNECRIDINENIISVDDDDDNVQSTIHILVKPNPATQISDVPLTNPMIASPITHPVIMKPLSSEINFLVIGYSKCIHL